MDNKNPDIIAQFINSYVNQPRYNELSEQEKSAMVDTLIQNYDDRINLIIVTYCPEDKKAELTQILKEGNQEKIDQFLGVHIPNLQELVEQETKEFVQDLLR